MLKTFNVYPKEGESFDIQVHSIDISETKDGITLVTLYDSGRFESKEGFISLDHVAAIVPEYQISSSNFEEHPLIAFNVYLRKQKEPVKIAAHSFDASQPPRVRFYIEVQRGGAIEVIELKLYIALSEVIMIMPADGLLFNR